jgi:branched-chain amino acid transport system ATP-binding protein
MLEIRDLHVCHAGVPALSGLTLRAEPGALTALVGANGAGKSTLLNTITGLHRASHGRICFDGADITCLRPDQITARGLALVPEGRRLFARQTVKDNLLLGAYLRPDPAERRDNLERVVALFPVLGQRFMQPAGQLSGGEQQMLAVGRALMSRPRMLLLDEPSIGLAPATAKDLFATIGQITRDGTDVVLVEQNLRAAIALATRLYVLREGSIALSGTPDQIAGSPLVRTAYLGL